MPIRVSQAEYCRIQKTKKILQEFAASHLFFTLVNSLLGGIMQQLSTKQRHHKFLPLNLLPDSNECKQGMQQLSNSAVGLMDTPDCPADKTQANYTTLRSVHGLISVCRFVLGVIYLVLMGQENADIWQRKCQLTT